MDWTPLWLTFKLALVTTILLIFVGIPLAFWLSESRRKWKPLIESIISLPLVLPPTVLGFYLLLGFSPERGLGQWLDNWLGLQFVFTFEGLVLGSMLYSLPFMVHPIQAGLANLPSAYREASYSLGKSKWQTLLYVLLPNIRPALLTGVILTFAHTIGEFGVVLMIGGNIPGITKVASIAIYDEVEAMNYDLANQYAWILLIFSFTLLMIVYFSRGKFLVAYDKG